MYLSIKQQQWLTQRKNLRFDASRCPIVYSRTIELLANIAAIDPLKRN